MWQVSAGCMPEIVNTTDMPAVSCMFSAAISRGRCAHPIVSLARSLTPCFSGTGFIMGHEFTGVVSEVGDSVKNFKKGDKVVSPFTVSW